MFKDPLKVIATPAPLKPEQLATSKFDKLWQNDPEQFNPERNALERERISRTFSLFPNSFSRAVDLGCGFGTIAKKLRDLGATVDAVDIAKIPLDRLAGEKNIRPIHDYVPKTKLEDEYYDLVICADLIAHLPENEYRLLFSELSRIIKKSGSLICSTPLDYHSEDAVQRFAMLAESEFEVEHWIFSYHLFYIYLLDFFEAPRRFVRASLDAEYRLRQKEGRKGLAKVWFRFNSQPVIALFWRLMQWPAKPFVHWIGQSRSLLITLEKMCRFLWADSGITHAIFRGKRRSLEKIPENERPIERKQKRQVWE